MGLSPMGGAEVLLLGMVPMGVVLMRPGFEVLDELLFLLGSFEGQEQVHLKLILVGILSDGVITYCIMALYWMRRFISLRCTSGGYFSKIRSSLFIIW